MAFIDFASLKKQVSIEQAIPLLNLAMKQHGQQWRGACPTCKCGGERALVVTQGRGFYCFGAKTGGDVIGLVSHIQGTDAKTSALFIAQSLSTVPEEQTRGLKEVSRNFQAPSVNLEEIAKRLDPEHEECGKLGLTPDTLKHFGGGYEKRGVARGNVIVQLHNAEGMLRGYVGLGETPWLPKDIAAEEYVFNWHRQTEGEIYIASSPRQVLIAFEQGVENMIAPLTSTITPLQLRFLASLFEAKGCTAVL